MEVLCTDNCYAYGLMSSQSQTYATYLGFVGVSLVGVMAVYTKMKRLENKTLMEDHEEIL